jgi:ORF6N domain
VGRRDPGLKRVKGASLPSDRVERVILSLRGQRVILDADLATLYGVETRALVQAVRRNLARFPRDFMFQLTVDEARHSRSQSVILDVEPPNSMEVSPVSSPHAIRGKNIKYLPHAFTEQGVAMLASVLRSPRAVRVNIEIVRAFVQLRQMMQTNVELARKLAALEKKYDHQFGVVFDAIRELMSPEVQPARKIGFRNEDP